MTDLADVSLKREFRIGRAYESYIMASRHKFSKEFDDCDAFKGNALTSEVIDQEVAVSNHIRMCGSIAGEGTAEGNVVEHCYDVFDWDGGTNDSNAGAYMYKYGRLEDREKQWSELSARSEVEYRIDQIAANEQRKREARIAEELADEARKERQERDAAIRKLTTHNYKVQKYWNMLSTSWFEDGMPMVLVSEYDDAHIVLETIECVVIEDGKPAKATVTLPRESAKDARKLNDIHKQWCDWFNKRDKAA